MTNVLSAGLSGRGLCEPLSADCLEGLDSSSTFGQSRVGSFCVTVPFVILLLLESPVPLVGWLHQVDVFFRLTDKEIISMYLITFAY